ncbi:MAG: cation:proton antiporter [Candidatus Methanomethylophilaceae archaeon]|nr:cation:proton antiporter [Candidatus Methanomethylophilaceae archaeon]
MDETLLLTSIALFTLLAGVCSIIFNKAKLPPLIGYLTAGIVIANAFTVDETGMSAIEILSDFGLVLLMFCIGLEINLKKIRKQGSFAILVVITQLPLTVLFGTIAGNIMGFDAIQSIVLGTVLSGCSTAAVMSVMTSQKTFSKEHINTIVLIIIMQDIGQVIMLSILTPVLAGSTMEVSGLVVLITSIAIFMVASIAIGLRYIPTLINKIADNVPSEILIVFSVGLAFFMAWLATIAGLSMAIGAFIMGLLMSSARNSESINSSVEPMKNLFMAMFFISVGMEVHLATLGANIGTILIFYLLFAGFLVITVFLGFWLGAKKGKIGFMSAIGMTAMGEFAFIISKEALDYGVVTENFYTSIIGAALLSMICMPILSRYSEWLWDKGSKITPAKLKDRFDRVNESRDYLYDSVKETTKKTQKKFRKSMTHAYINFMAIVIIEIIFFVAVPVISPILSDMYGGNPHLWDFALVMLNFVVLIPPTDYLVDNVKFFDDIINETSKQGASKVPDARNRGKRYQELLAINEYIAVVIIDLIIIAVVPNPLSLAEHIFVALAAIVILFLILRRIKNRNKGLALEDGDETLEPIKED